MCIDNEKDNSFELCSSRNTRYIDLCPRLVENSEHAYWVIRFVVVVVVVVIIIFINFCLVQRCYEEGNVQIIREGVPIYN